MPENPSEDEAAYQAWCARCRLADPRIPPGYWHNGRGGELRGLPDNQEAERLASIPAADQRHKATLIRMADFKAAKAARDPNQAATVAEKSPPSPTPASAPAAAPPAAPQWQPPPALPVLHDGDDAAYEALPIGARYVYRGEILEKS